MSSLSIHRQLLDSIEDRDADYIRALVAAGADVNFTGSDPDAETPLIRAVTAERLDVVQLLIASGAYVNCAGKLSGWTPLMFARDNPMILCALISAGANVNARTPPREMVEPVTGRRLRRGGETALHFAAAVNNAEAIHILAEVGADVEAEDESGCAPIDVALRVGSPTEAAIALVEECAKLTQERLEVMHSGAHEPHSLLSFFPGSGELAFKTTNPVSAPPEVSQPSASKARSYSFTCPNCGALTYSRKARICGHCGAKIPGGLNISDSQAKILEDERKWARSLADAFTPANSSGDSPIKPKEQSHNLSAAGLIMRAACAPRPRRKLKPGLLLYLIFCGLGLIFVEWLTLRTLGEVPLSITCVNFGMFTAACIWVWRRTR